MKEVKELSFITLTNNGYLAYTFNCLASLKKIGVDYLKTYAIGKKATRSIARKNYKAELIDDELNAEFQTFRKGNWANITYYKFQIIFENLKNSKFVCFTDGDVVFKNKSFIDYCISHIGAHDLLIQNDSLDDESDENLCSGFMFIRSSEKTLKFFNPKYVKENSNLTEGWGDQIYVNENKEKIAFKLLPLALFPNGKYFELNHLNITPYLIHFNWLIGHSKSRMIVKHKEYYSTELLLLFIKNILLRKYRNRVNRLLHEVLRVAK